jgi:hypothetical protein
MRHTEDDRGEGQQGFRNGAENMAEDADKLPTSTRGRGKRDGPGSETETLRSALEAVESNVQSTGKPLDI